MPATYEVHMDDPFTGQNMEVFKTFEKLEYARKENDYGTLDLTLPNTGQWPWEFFKEDARFSVYRTIAGSSAARLDVETEYFLKDWEFYTDPSSFKKYIHLVAYDANYLLDGHEVEYNSGSSQAAKTDYIDDMMKEIVAENMGASATDTTRDLSAYLSIQQDFSLAPSTTKEFARKTMLSVFQELATESYQRGTYLVFDIAYTSPTKFEFRTYTGQRGANRGSTSSNTLIFAERNGTLKGGKLGQYHAPEVNVVNGGGQGTGSDRIMVQVINTAALNASPFARREEMYDCRQASTTTSIEADARGELYQKRPKIVLSGQIMENEVTLYGRDFGFGDLVVVEHEGVTMDCHINGVHISVDKGVEMLDISVRGEV